MILFGKEARGVKDKDAHKSNLRRLKHDPNFKKRVGFLLELIITLPIGAITAFIFERKVTFALIALGVFVFSFIVYCIVLVIEENKVSVLSIMSEGLKDGRYEDVIKFGSAMSPTLFTSNKNFDRVKLGRLLLEACQNLAQAEHSAREDIIIASGGSRKSVKQIKIELLLDDLGWSLYLTETNNTEATNNIQEAIKLSRLEIKRIKNKHKNTNPQLIQKSIEVYMKYILRGYRHLTGIYYSSQKTFDLAKNYERITHYILSGGNILSFGGSCSARITDDGNVCGLTCNKNDKTECIMSNIKRIYYSEEKLKEVVSLQDYIDLHQVKVSLVDLVDDMNNYSTLSNEAKEKILREQSYAWSRNIVKWLQKNIHSSWDATFSKTIESNKSYFISDEERLCKIRESLSFARLYYYGKEALTDSDLNDFDTIISTDLIKTEQQRYLTLTNEIALTNYEFSLFETNDNDISAYNESHNAAIEIIIDHIKQTREACRGLRADLFARNTSFLIKALLVQYNMNVRYNMGDESTISYRMNCIDNIKEEATSLYQEVVNYEHCDNEEVRKALDSLLIELKFARKEIKKWKFIYVKNRETIILDTDSDVASYYKSIPLRKVEDIKLRWKIE